MEEPQGKYKCRRCDSVWDKTQIRQPPAGSSLCGREECGGRVEYVPPPAGQQLRYALDGLRFHEGLTFTTDFVTQPETGGKLSVTLYTNAFSRGVAVVDYPGGGATLLGDFTPEVYPHRIMAEMRARLAPVLVTGEPDKDEPALYHKLLAAFGQPSLDSALYQARGERAGAAGRLTGEEALAVLRGELEYAAQFLGLPDMRINGRSPAMHMALCAELFEQVDRRVRGLSHP
jgi:hypothetical protein